jgi:hypothetical protein
MNPSLQSWHHVTIVGVVVVFIAVVFHSGFQVRGFEPELEKSQLTLRSLKQEWFRQYSSATPALFLEESKFNNLTFTHPREIRLLKISRHGPETFTHQFVHVSLDHQHLPPYIAVSYHWGGKPDNIKSLLTGSHQSLNLTGPAFFVLDSLLDEGVTLWLWIDAQCIDQQNDTEVEHQILLMRHIYKSAHQVVISLGEPTNDSSVAMDFIETVYTALDNLRNKSVSISTEAVCKETNATFPGPKWTALSRLFRRKWFSRTWVIQEVAVGKNPVFVWGDRAVGWDTMLSVAVRLFSENLFLLLEKDHTHPKRRLTPPEGIKYLGELNAARLIVQQREPESLQGMLLGFHHFNTTNARDKIYALLGISSDMADKRLPVNFSGPIEEVYRNTSIYLLLQNDSILILHKAGIGFPRVLKGLPSWVPDWTSFYPPLSFGGISRYAGYRAASDTVPNVKKGLDPPHTLIIDGWVVGEVEKLGSMRPPIIGYTEEEVEFIRTRNDWVREAENLSKSLMPAGMTLQEAFARTLIANFTTSDASGRMASNILKYYESWWQYMKDREDYGVPRWRYSDAWKEIATFDDVFASATTDRKFFVTKEGFMGLTSPETCSGDRVVIFSGGTTPFIIRRDQHSDGKRSSYTLVGEAYIHGLMNGEGLNNSKIEEIELR